MLSILGFLIMLAPLVIVHELGHFLFAKLFNVKAEAFSIGFGPRIFKKQIGETEWRVSLIPLGGYVKLLGEDPNQQPLTPEDAKRTLTAQKPWKRFFIFFGGPLFNFLWAVLVYMTILLVGEPQMASVAGRVLPHSPAAQSGLVSGDRIVSIDGQPVAKFDEVQTAIEAKPEQSLTFHVSRTDPATGTATEYDVKAITSKQNGFSEYGEEKQIGELVGLLPTARDSTIGVSNLATPGAKAGFRTGDRINSWNGRPITTWEEIDLLYERAAPGSTISLKGTSKSQNGATLAYEFKKPAKSHSLGEDTGLFSSETFIDKTVEKSPAEETGLRSGDRIVSIQGQPITNFFALRDAVQVSGEKHGKVPLVWEREGKRTEATITPTATTNRDALLNKQTQFTIGIAPLLIFATPATVTERIYNPFVLLYKGTERMVTFTYRNFVSIKKMFTGEVSMKTLGGPILIGKIAGESLSRGLVAFLSTMAILSIGLGVLNILPIPVLDGGHILLLIIESIRGRPLSMKQLEVVQMTGLSLIAFLMFVVFKNDLARLTLFN